MAKSKLFFIWLSVFCIIAFLLQIIIPGFTDFFVLDDRANNDEIWRFVTSIFLHGDIAHLFYNLFALVFFGIILEKKIGSNRFLLIFLVSGILANVFAINFYDSSLGASGAIYGIIGALTTILPFMLIFAFGLPMPLILASILWVSGDVLRTLGAFGPTNVGTLAHLAGIAVGLFMGWSYRKKKQ
ncbi:rhomboid family intramembrane serine protease [Candidatus Pacearchaeota archaeon]|nr:rhomboid family intramembrane serine protease [Candidatus Pacearchaeota archaeon]